MGPVKGGDSVSKQFTNPTTRELLDYMSGEASSWEKVDGEGEVEVHRVDTFVVVVEVYAAGREEVTVHCCDDEAGAQDLMGEIVDVGLHL